MTGRPFFLILVLCSVVLACKAEKPVERKKPEHVVLIRTKHPVLSAEQREELGFPSDVISKIELAAGTEAEPFFATVVKRSENLKGEKEFEQKELAGFSVRTKNSDEIIASYRTTLRMKGFLIFKSHKGYGSLADIVTVIKGNNSYDILNVQGTEAPNYQLDTKAIVAWLKDCQKDSSFVVTGAGPDWLETRFIKPPQNMTAFAKKIVAFSPDVLERGPQTFEKLVERMKRMNGFFLVWD